jgi:hypothetical protein
MLGIPTTDTAFDTDIIVNINSAFMVLNQLGVGTETVFSIEDATAIWTDFLADSILYPAVKSYMYLKLRLIFDPPGTSYLLDSIKSQILEYEWRLTVQVPIPPEA